MPYEHTNTCHHIHTPSSLKMGFLTPFTSPNDVRWRGPQRHHHTLFLIKNTILLLFIILVIVEYPLFKNWWENGPYYYRKSWEYAP